MFWKKNKIIKNTGHIAFNGLHMKDDLFTEHILQQSFRAQAHISMDLKMEEHMVNKSCMTK